MRPLHLPDLMQLADEDGVALSLATNKSNNYSQIINNILTDKAKVFIIKGNINLCLF